MKKAGGLVVPHVLNSVAWENLKQYCHENGICLEGNGISRYKHVIQRYRCAVTWGVKWRHEAYLGNGRDMLFIENGLLNQKFSMSVDSRGYFSDSELCVDKEYLQEPTKEEIENLSKEIQLRYGKPLFVGGNPDGPILIALQTRRDAPVTFQYPLDRKSVV